MKFLESPLWQAGFRPFFPLAALAGLVLPLAWVALLHGGWQWSGNLSVPIRLSVQWHAHEMFFGFGGAVLVGFLLTASKNWVGIAGYRGASLAALVALWLLDRLAVTWGANWPPTVFWVATLGFATLAVVMLLQTLVVHRAHDTFAVDNLFFILVLPLLLPAKYLLLAPDYFAAGVAMATGIFRMAFLLMLERTVPAFLNGALQLKIRRNPMVDRSIKWLALGLCFAPWLPGFVLITGELALASLLLWRLGHWQLRAAFSRLEIGIMHLGCIAIALQLLLDGLLGVGLLALPGSVALHVFSLGALGCIVPAMFIRIASGHTGRRIVFGHHEKTILVLAIIALLLRTLAVAILPAFYLRWIELSAFCWALLFAMWLWKFAIWLVEPRADGKSG